MEDLYRARSAPQLYRSQSSYRRLPLQSMPPEPMTMEKTDPWARRMVPYFVSAVLAQKKTPKGGELFFAIVGLVLHCATWALVVALDCSLLGFHFSNDETTKNKLQAAATISVCIAGGTVIVLWILQVVFNSCFHKWAWNWNDGLLPPFLSSTIIGLARTSLKFTEFLLLFLLFMPTEETQGENAASMYERNILIAQIALKHYGISMTMNNHRVKVYDDEEPVSMPAS